MQLVTIFSQIEDNAIRFFEVLQRTDTVAFKRLGQFFHWYYFPESDVFAPSKFIGYKDMTVDIYDGSGTGTKTQDVLQKWFAKVDRTSELYRTLHNRLTKILGSVGKSVSTQTDRKGGIYLPTASSDLLDKTEIEADGQYAGDLSVIASSVIDEGYFSPETLQDEREHRLRAIVERRGQPDFRKKLISAYNGRCAVTGCDALAALEAAHIIPYCGKESNHVSNGLLLRADIHTLFDLDLIGLDPKKLSISLNPVLKNTSYNDLQGRMLALPKQAGAQPNTQAIAKRWKRFTLGSRHHASPRE